MSRREEPVLSFETMAQKFCDVPRYTADQYKRDLHQWVENMDRLDLAMLAAHYCAEDCPGNVIERKGIANG